MFHTDLQKDKIFDIQKKYGDGVSLKSFTQEHLFILENNIPGKTINDIIQEFELITYEEYISRCTKFRNEHL